MYRMSIIGGNGFFEEMLRGTPLGMQPCGWCGDDMGIHERVVAVVEEERGKTTGFEVVGCDRRPRTWRMWARRQENPVEGRDFMYFGDEQAVHKPWMGRGEPTAVELTEDPEGTYYGWIACDPEDGHAGVPKMIQPHPVMFRAQEPSGFRDRVETGRGEIVRMTVRPSA